MQHKRVHTIKTAEGIEFSFLLASPLIRCMAAFIDFLLINTVVIVLNIISLAISLVSYDFSSAFLIIIFFTLNTGYPIISEYLFKGQTLGKWILKIRVVDQNALQLTFAQLFIRNILRAIDFFPAFYVVGGLISLFNQKCKRLGDIVASTLVIHNHNALDISLERLQLSSRYNLFHDQTHFIASLRQSLSIEEITIIYQAVLRRDQLDAERRTHLFKEIISDLKKRIHFPEEIIFGISEEEIAKHLLSALLAK